MQRGMDGLDLLAIMVCAANKRRGRRSSTRNARGRAVARAGEAAGR